MKSICFFSSYFNQDKIPYYVRYYVEELNKHFTEMVFLTNEKQLAEDELNYLSGLGISLQFVKNEGYDFGMWYKGLTAHDLSEYDRVGLVNDSCVLFKSLAPVFDWVNSCGLDFCGLVSSKRIAFHVQSYFLIINKNAIKPVRDYFLKNGIINDYKQVIQTYEVGLNKYIQSQQLKAGALYFSKKDFERHNPSFFIIDELIKEGIPMIKKKIIFRAYRVGEYLTLFRMNFDIDHRHYIDLIKEVNKNQECIDFDRVLKDFQKKNSNDICLYNILIFLYKIASKSKILTYLFHQMILFRRKIRGDKNKDIVITSETKL